MNRINIAPAVCKGLTSLSLSLRQMETIYTSSNCQPLPKSYVWR